MLKTYKYRIYPDKEQKVLLTNAFGSCRFIYNKALAYKKDTYEKTSESLSYYDLQNGLLKDLKSEHDWLKLSPSQSLQMSLRHLDSAYKNFFRRIKSGGPPGFPKFKSKFGKQSISFPQGIRIDSKSSKIFIPKLKNTLAVIHRKIPDNCTIKTCTISKTITNKYYISVLFEDHLEKPEKILGKEIGIDLGIKDFCTFSDGPKVHGQKFLNKYLKKLQYVQSKLSLKKKVSSNRNKVKFQLARVHEKIANSRKDNLHKISKKIIDENQVIFLEDLSVKSMMQESYRNLARNIGYVSWGEFVTMLKYKSDLYGKYVFEVNPAYTSRMCSNCFEINNKLQLSDRVWQCKHCQIEHDRDINAACNILRIGQELPEYQKALNSQAAKAA